MASGRLLVIAKSSDLQRSLVFALEAEGFEVTAHDEQPSISWLAEHPFDCAVVEQKSLTGEPYECIAFCIKAHPVVLLAAQPHKWLVEWVAQVVETPSVSDTALTSAVRLAIRA